MESTRSLARSAARRVVSTLLCITHKAMLGAGAGVLDDTLGS